MRVGINGFQPERLTQIREARGLSKISLGCLTERSPSSVTKWENGTHSPDAEAIERLGIVLNCPVTWFTKPVTKRESKPVFFRTLANTAKDLCTAANHHMGWLQEVSLLFQEYLDYPVVNVPCLNVIDYREIDDRTIEVMAAKCRQQWGLGIAPVQDLLLSMENAGIVCSRFKQNSAVMDGYSQWNESEGRPYVILASDKDNYYRSRFDAAHELGHIVLHRYVDKLDLINFKPVEEQAHKFASCLMLPEESFSTELPLYPTSENFITLKSRWGMSVQAMIHRAKSLELISAAEYQRLYKNISARGWRKCEPLDDIRKPESVRLLPRCLNLLLENNIFSKSTLPEYLSMSCADIENILSLPEGYLTEIAISDIRTKVRLKNNTRNTASTRNESNVIDIFNKKKQG